MKAALGCAIGCGVFALLAVVGGGIAAWWVVSPGKQRSTLAVASPAAAGTFQVGDLGADDGVTALLDHVIRESQRQQQRGAPPWLRQLQQAGSYSGSPSTGLRMLLPRQATLAIEPPVDGEDPAWIVAFNPRGLTRVFRTLMPSQTAVGTHRGHELLSFGVDSFGAIVDGTVLVSNEEAALRGAIDRLLAGEATPPPPPPDLGTPVRGWDLAGTVDNRSGLLGELLYGESREAPVPGVVRALVGVDAASRDLAAGRVVVVCSDGDAVAVALEALRARAAERAEALAANGLDLRSAVRSDGERAVLDWEIHGLAGATSRWVAENVESSPEL
jgi:hypothetical protein